MGGRYKSSSPSSSIFIVECRRASLHVHFFTFVTFVYLRFPASNYSSTIALITLASGCSHSSNLPTSCPKGARCVM